jgi:arylsulfatase A
MNTIVKMFMVCSFLHAALAASPPQPNILLILADDLGYQDVGCYGGDLIETPHIDRLASKGVRFTQAYAMCVCSPSRAELMTGKYAARLHITIWSEGSLKGPKHRKLLQGHSLHDLPHSETTIATHLQNAGYLTALVGKWHLGDAGHFPETHGFDVNIGGNHWGAPQTFWWPYRGDKRYGGEFRYVPHTEFGQPEEFLTDRLTDEAISIIDKAGDRPFFLYLAHYAPHTPIEAKPADVHHFTAKLNPDMNHQNAVYAAMVKNMDDNVGRILAQLKERNLEQKTIVIFASDNGGFIGKDRGQTVPVTSNAPLRSGKGSLYEGGIRVPLIIHWPGLSKAGAVCDESVTLRDLYHTLLPLAKEEADHRTHDDGMDISTLLKHPTAKLTREALYFHYPHYYSTTTPVSAMRQGDWKLLEYFEDRHIELYNLKEDLDEAHDLADQCPDKVAELRERLRVWRQSLSASLPQPNPDYVHKGEQNTRAMK